MTPAVWNKVLTKNVTPASVHNKSTAFAEETVSMSLTDTLNTTKTSLYEAISPSGTHVRVHYEGNWILVTPVIKGD